MLYRLKKEPIIQPNRQFALQTKHIKIAIFKETRSVTMDIFRKKKFLFKSSVKIELSYVFTINMLSTAENCMVNSELSNKTGDFSLVRNY